MAGDEDGDPEITVSVRMPASLARNARALGRMEHHTFSQVMRMMLERYVASGPKQLTLEDMIRAEGPKPRSKGRK
ncbi:hypothetical protein [Belnapia moabensis]|uniref:hypothetical protein n=1 Tax=Belnapia moabensis TaxID=365533 RepID=UPI0005BAF790|nr:hypothetical protein [Belnapia moabensis]